MAARMVPKTALTRPATNPTSTPWVRVVGPTVLSKRRYRKTAKIPPAQIYRHRQQLSMLMSGSSEKRAIRTPAIREDRMRARVFIINLRNGLSIQRMLYIKSLKSQ